MEFGYEPSLDSDAEAATDRIVARMREGLARVPLRSAFVDALGVEARPAVQALLFAIATDRADDPTSLEHHETTAMIALLGRAFAFDGTTPTAAASIVPALLAGFRAEGFVVPAVLDRPLELVFLEGYVRGREERIRHESGQRALESVVLTRLAPKVGLIVIRGAHEPELLASRGESLAREAFGLELEACVVDVALREAGDAVFGPIASMIELMRSVGIAIVVSGAGANGAFSSDVATRESTVDAIAAALAQTGLTIARERAIPRSLRELLRTRSEGRRGAR